MVPVAAVLRTERRGARVVIGKPVKRLLCNSQKDTLAPGSSRGGKFSGCRYILKRGPTRFLR